MQMCFSNKISSTPFKSIGNSLIRDYGKLLRNDGRPTLTMLGLLPEVVTISQAEEIYGKRLIKEWREKAWIKFYPANNKERGKYYVKRSELETASAMMDLHNKVPDNIIKQLMQIAV